MMTKKGSFLLSLFVLGLAIWLVNSKTAVSSLHLTNNQTLYLPLIQTPLSDQPNINLNVQAATYLGGAGADFAHGIDIAPDGSLVMVGVMPNHNPGGVTAVSLLGGGDGVIIRLAPDGQSVRSVTRIGNVVRDLTVANNGRILVCGDFGVALLNATADDLIWSDDTLGSSHRCDLGSDGTTAVLVKVSNGADQVHVFADDGTTQATWSSSGSGQHWQDVAVAANEQAIILTGYTQKTSNLQVPFIYATSYDGQTEKWTAYDFAASAVLDRNLGADSRGQLVVIGRDGLLYFAGTTDGGNTVYGRNPQNINQSLPADTLIRYDAYNNPFQLSGSTKFTFYGRFNPATGQILQGQYLLTRLSNGNGNSISPNGMMADENGRLYLSGESYARMDNRDNRQIAAITVGPYSGGEPFLLIVSQDFQTRIIWTTFAGSNGAGGSPAYGVSVRQGVAAVAIGLREGDRNLITHNALQPNRGNDRDAYIATWRQMDE